MENRQATDGRSRCSNKKESSLELRTEIAKAQSEESMYIHAGNTIEDSVVSTL